MEAFDVPAALPPAVLPDAYVAAAMAVRPTLVAGAQPVAVVILLDIDARGAGT
jgi:hypothetical protein